MSPGNRRISEAYRSPLRDSLILQAFFIFVSSLALDGGMMLRYSLFALAPTWALILLIVLRHPANPTTVELKAVRFSYLAFFLIVPGLSALASTLVD